MNVLQRNLFRMLNFSIVYDLSMKCCGSVARAEPLLNKTGTLPSIADTDDFSDKHF